VRAVFVRVFGVGALCTFSFEPRVPLLEGVRDVIEEDEAEHDVLVLGSVHRAAERVGLLPELDLVADAGTGRIPRARVVLPLSQGLPHGMIGHGRSSGSV
jgi:hypothetical protein